jgi:hypothetical protein
MATAKRARTSSKKAPAKTTVPAPEEPVGGNGERSFDFQSAIRARAYELYEKRGRQDGYAQQDWLQAESEVLAQLGHRGA